MGTYGDDFMYGFDLKAICGFSSNVIIIYSFGMIL